MTPELVMTLGQETIKTTLLLAAPLLACALIVGLIVSVFQAITQINEATLSFIPKILAIAVTLVVCAPWMLDVITRFTTTLFENITTYVR
ncbi:MAG: flagellar biosynthesis protein FliQ [Oligoflexia bacterium]|nr:flagellar biosynthesis protein FliQ [Oligoflexia bacterium]